MTGERTKKGERYWVLSPDKDEDPRVYSVVDTGSAFDDEMWRRGGCHPTRETAFAALRLKRKAEKKERNRVYSKEYYRKYTDKCKKRNHESRKKAKAKRGGQ